MKIRFIPSVFLVLILYATVYGQVTQEEYNRAVDFLNCRIVGESLRSDESSYREYQERLPCDREFSVEKTTEFLGRLERFEATIELFHEIEGLKKSYDPARNSDDLITFLSRDVFRDPERYPNLYKFADKRKKTPRFGSIFGDLQTDLKKQLDQDPSPIPAPTTTPGTLNRVRTEIERGWDIWMTYIFFILFVLLILGIAVWIFYIQKRFANLIGMTERNLRRNQIEISDVRDEFRQLARRTRESLTADLRSTAPQSSGEKKDTYSKGLKQEQEKNASYQKLLGEEREKATQYRKILEEVSIMMKERLANIDKASTALAVIPREDVDSQFPEKAIFYMSVPNEDGSFNAASASPTYKEGASIFMFRKISDDAAEFKLDSHDGSIRLAFRNTPRSIDPVCDSENPFDPAAARVITIRSGRTKLQGDKWKLIEKARIRYER